MLRNMLLGLDRGLGYTYGFILLVAWIMGIVLAKGFWSTIFSIIIVPYAWYLVVEFWMQLFGLI